MKILHYMRKVFWVLYSYTKKERFKKGKSLSYRYMDEIFCDGKDEFEKIVKLYGQGKGDFWDKEKKYSLSTYYANRYSKAEKMIFNDFLPLYSQKPILMDVGCANGERTIGMSSYCNSIDGFEYSHGLVETANANSKQVENVHFYQKDARNMQLEKIYDGALIQGMLMYIDNEEDIYQILKNVFDNIIPGGYLCTRDTLNRENRKVIFLYNIKNGYNAVYWDKEVYYEQFHKAGFVLVNEYSLDEVKTRRMDFEAIGAIWQKPLMSVDGK